MVWRHSVRPLAVALVVAALAGCDSFADEQARLQIREEFCRDWPYGCTDSTRVVIEKVRETRNGRQVMFRVVDREDDSGTRSAAYFEEHDDGWRFLLFEDPFKETFNKQAALYKSDGQKFTDALMDLKAAQRWFQSIYGRYARGFEELDSVSYRVPDLPIRMQTEDSTWKAEVSSDRVQCEFDVGKHQLPRCAPRWPATVGTPEGPLSTVFRDKD